MFNMPSEARLKNAALDVTGHLLYTKEVFVQCIEGPPASIAILWDSLQRDTRHYEIELLARGPLVERRFSNWSMAFSSYPSLNRFDLPGLFPVDAEGINLEVARCSAV